MIFTVKEMVEYSNHLALSKLVSEYVLQVIKMYCMMFNLTNLFPATASNFFFLFFFIQLVFDMMYEAAR